MPLRNLIAAIHPRLAVVLHDMAMVWVAWTAVSMLRWSLEVNPPSIALFGPEVWLVLGAQGVIFWWTGLYNGLWRFASLPDLWNIVKAAVLGALAIAHHAVPLQPPRNGAAYRADGVSDRARGAARRAATDAIATGRTAASISAHARRASAC